MRPWRRGTLLARIAVKRAGYSVSHVLLNFIYRLRMLATGRLRARGPLQKLVELSVRAPSSFDRVLDGVVAKVLDGARVVPVLSEVVEAEVASAVVGRVGPAPEPGSEVAPAREGVVRKAVRYSALAEGFAVSSALRASTLLQGLQRSLERSLLVSALLAGVTTTTAFLFIAIRLR